MASRSPPGDPRIMAPLPEEAGVMPVVRLPRAGLPIWAIGAGAVLAGLLLFLFLDARRQDRGTVPSVSERAADSLGTAAPPPPLFVPPLPQPPSVSVAAPSPPAPQATAPPPQPQIVYVPQPYPVPTPAPKPPPRSRRRSGSATSPP